MKLLISIVSIMGASFISFSKLATAQTAEKSPVQLTKLIETVPATPWYLFAWPEAKRLDGGNRMNAGDDEVQTAKTQSWSWIRRALDPDWLPPSDDKMIFLRKEFGDCDTTRIQWTHDGFQMEVSQTRTVFALKLTPLENQGTGLDAKARFEYARDLALKVLADDADMHQLDGQGAGKIEIPDLKEKIASYSFDPARWQMLRADKSVIGMPKSMKDEGVTSSASADGEENEAVPQDATKSPQAWSYWFRNIRWWNDGKSVGIYFLKMDGPGPTIISYVGGLDANWFRE